MIDGSKKIVNCILLLIFHILKGYLEILVYLSDLNTIMISNPVDIELVRKLQKGDVQAFDCIYLKYSQKLYLFCLKYIKSKDEAEELVQSVFLKLWENHKKLKKESSLKSYLFTIAYNDICKMFRKRYYQQKYILDILYESAQPSNLVEESISYKSVNERVQQIVEKLNEKQKTIFKKSRFEGKPTIQIAEEMNLSPGTIDNYISDILKILRSKLVKEDLFLILLISLF